MKFKSRISAKICMERTNWASQVAFDFNSVNLQSYSGKHGHYDLSMFIIHAVLKKPLNRGAVF
jgi:uncharacterized membrane protein